MRHRLALTAIPLLVAGGFFAGCGSSSPTGARAIDPAGIPGGGISVSPAAVVKTGRPAVATAGATAGATGPGTITTVGTGTVSGTPDEMTVSIGVQTAGVHAASALQEDNSVSRAVQAALSKDGVSSADIQTSGLSLYQQDPSSGGGYQAEDSITAVIRHLGSAGSAIDDAVAAAGDAGRLEGVSFAFSDDSSLMSRARQAAVADARAQAQQLATAAGVTLGSLQSLSGSQQSPGPYPVSVGTVPTASSAPPVPVQPGTQQESVSVTAVWAIG
jgi:uncharacterized protein YggE